MKKLPFYCLILIVISSCNSVKYISQGDQLLTKNTIYIDGVKNPNSTINDYLIQRPNRKSLGVPLSLYFYNLGNPKGSKTPREWGIHHPKTYRFFKKIFSEKQSIGAAKTFIGINNWFLKNGDPPVIISKKKIKHTLQNLKVYYQTQGYFQSKIISKIDTIAKKKGAVSYYITKGNPIFLDSISTDIASPVIDFLYKTKKKNSYLKSGEQYKNINFIKEATRLTKLFRNNGVYHFSENYIGFYGIDTANINYKTNVHLKISNRLVQKNGTYVLKPLKIQKVSKVNIYTDYTYEKRNEPYLDSVSYKGFQFFAHQKLKYNPKYLSQSLFIKPNTIYSDSLRNLTRIHLHEFLNFKTTTIKYTEKNDNELTANIFLTPIEKYTLRLETELTRSNIRNLGVSGKFSIINRNAFRGSELFKLSFLGSFFNTSKDTGKDAGFFNSWEIGTKMSLEVPRFMAPFGLGKLIPKRMFPTTKFSMGTSFRKNIGLDKQLITASINYDWKYNERKNIQLELFNTQYVQNLNVNNYFQIYSSEYNRLNTISKIYKKDPTYNLPIGTNNFQKVIDFSNTLLLDFNFQQSHPKEYKKNLNILNRYNIITSNFLIPVIAYSFTYNTQESLKDDNFSFFKIRVANSGNILGLLSSDTDDNQQKTLFNIRIAQYFKTDIEYKHFWGISNNSVIGFRAFLGATIPYNGSFIPFTKSYFAGGSNDIRGWKTYDLGSGKAPQEFEYNIGDLKFLTSLEYRFDVLGNLKGALFIDSGNIWNFSDTDISTSKFKGIESLKDLALSCGFGIRYDLKFLIARLDLGFKTYEPYLAKNRWFQNFNFSNVVYNIGINYPF